MRKDIWKNIDRSVDELNGKVSETTDPILNALLVMVKDLDVDSDGKIKRTAKNFNAVVNAKKIGLIAKKQLDQPVKEFVNGFDKQAKLVEDYYKKTK